MHRLLREARLWLGEGKLRRQQMAEAEAPRGRIIGLDVARALAVVGMVIYHFTFDLGLFGFTPPNYAVTGFWAMFARAVAGSFLLLAGAGLVLAHGRGIVWPRFWRRFGIIAGAALLVTLATRFVMPEQFVFYGILHSIAVSSLLGLAMLRLPFAALLGLAAVFLALPQMFRHAAFDTPMLWWLGLSPSTPASMDFEPLFPWFGAFLLGMALAKILAKQGLLVPHPVPRWLWRATWIGRHSLVIYLLHQPVLMGLFIAYIRLNG